ncbi:hypothetical protein AB0I34_44020, partial [Kribbella sp. NPDC050281]|uniref:hypothetical protein n=1 Tax=Kribbella sp. NPDC050281 TaxID=3155515 RepID=UPI0033CA7669
VLPAGSTLSARRRWRLCSAGGPPPLLGHARTRRSSRARARRSSATPALSLLPLAAPAYRTASTHQLRRAGRLHAQVGPSVVVV